jgi:hypothetical protein
MGKRTLLSIGYAIPGYEKVCLGFDSERSLLDADVILFQPSFHTYYSSTFYMGKRRLSDDDSSRAVEHSRRWKQELTEALKAGKTLVIFLSSLEEVYVHLGRKEVSGTGRSQKVTYIVELLTNYSALPFDLGTVVPKGGMEIHEVTDLKQIAPYWAVFGGRSPYKVYLKQPKGIPLLMAKAPDAVVGLLIKSGKGTAVLLPPVEYDEEKFTKTDKKGEEFWTKEAMAFGSQLFNALLELDRALRAESEITPAPEWAFRPDFYLPIEIAYETEIVEKEKEIERLRNERDILRAKASEAGALRDLLYEAGKPLEKSILRALRAMGFTATPFREGGSEFDVVFSAPEGRFLGEAEGKNDKAISVEKLDQLERNIREDFSLQEQGTYAKGVLFGNAFRLHEPATRSDFFTQKCYVAAARGKIALVRTPDLFAVTRYLEDNNDPAFAAACRKAILDAEGTVVAFPSIPAPTE